MYFSQYVWGPVRARSPDNTISTEGNQIREQVPTAIILKRRRRFVVFERSWKLVAIAVSVAVYFPCSWGRVPQLRKTSMRLEKKDWNTNSKDDMHLNRIFVVLQIATRGNKTYKGESIYLWLISCSVVSKFMQISLAFDLKLTNQFEKVKLSFE